MQNSLDAEAVLLRFAVDTIEKLQAAFRTLLEQKHLYQSLVLQLSDPIAEAKGAPLQLTFVERVRGFREGKWHIIDPQVKPPTDGRLVFRPPDVRLFCDACDRIEPYNLVSAEDFLSRAATQHLAKGQCQQVFVLSYLCQSCKGVPEVLVIARSGLRLTNVGRSPMEQVQVPANTPGHVRRFYKDALLAYQSGQVLPAIFMLRTLLEQRARQVIGKERVAQCRSSADGRAFADRIMDAYMASLHPTVRDEFPSMRALYGALSADLHEAVGDAAVFEKAVSEIDEHFEACAMFERRAARAAGNQEQISAESPASTENT